MAKSKGERQYIAIDLKSFYASVECLERGLDPIRVSLVVADESRTDKTICLAVTPALKAFGVPGRPRLFEVEQRVRAVNQKRKNLAPGGKLAGKSYITEELERNPALALDFLIAPPRMSLYLDYSAKIFRIYQEYISPEDIHVYSIDEVFLDATDYLTMYKMTAPELAAHIIKDVYARTGITATAGIGTNLYLSKVAMDVVAKHVPPDENGVRIASLDVASYRRTLWEHRPLTDFWRVGKASAEKLEKYGIYTMGDVARCSLEREDWLYRLFGVNAELLIDHAWGWEPCTIEEIKAYRPKDHSLGAGQVLSAPYPFEKGRLIVREMAELLSLDLVEKGLVADRIVLTVGYDVENLKDPARRARYRGEIHLDRYGREVPKHGRGTVQLGGYTSSSKQIADAAVELFDRIADPDLLVRRLYLTFARVLPRGEEPCEPVQLDLFTDNEAQRADEERRKAEQGREQHIQEAVLAIRKKFGKNALVKGMDLEEGATSIERNETIGGHKK